MTVKAAGVMVLIVGLGVAGGGLLLARRYAAATEHTGFTSSPRRESAYGFLGQLLFILGLIGVMIGSMLAFF